MATTLLMPLTQIGLCKKLKILYFDSLDSLSSYDAKTMNEIDEELMKIALQNSEFKGMVNDCTLFMPQN